MIEVELPGARALFTDRRGGLHADPERLERHVGRPVVFGRQVHGTRVRRIDASAAGADVEADGQATALTDVAVAVRVADCLPVAIASPGAVAMVHAGWRGLVGGVLEEGVRAVRELGRQGPVAAAIGPGAGGCCYEVGPEVRSALGEPASQGLVDLKAHARRRLEAAGAERVDDVGICTLCAEEGRFFSHRRDGGDTGRQAGVAWRVSSPG